METIKLADLYSKKTFFANQTNPLKMECSCPQPKTI